jgi:hypothetical protein
VGDEFLFGEIIGSVDAFEGVSELVDVDGDELGLGKRTPSKEIPLTSSFTTNCGSPVDEFSVQRAINQSGIHQATLSQLTFADNLKLHAIQHRRAQIVKSVRLLLVMCLRRSIVPTVLDVGRVGAINGLAGNFRWCHVRVVVVDVMMMIVVHDGTLAAEVAVGANQAFLSRWNVVVV